MKTRSLIFWLLVFLCFPNVQVAKAETGNDSLRISPFYSDVTIGEKDESKQLVFKIANQSSGETSVKLSFVDLGTLDASGGIPFQGMKLEEGAPGGKYSLAEWVRMEKEQETIGPGETKDIIVTILNDGKLSSGGHYGALMVQAQSSEENENLKMKVSPILTAMVFLKKEGGEIYDLVLDKNEMKKTYFSFPEKVTLLFSNRGNVHVIPRGTVTVKDLLGRTIARSAINIESRLILPETSRTMEVPIRKFPGIRLSGKYEIQIDHRYDGKNEFDSQKIGFYYISPFQIGLGLLLTIFAFSSILYCLIIKVRKKGQNSTEYEQKKP